MADFIRGGADRPLPIYASRFAKPADTGNDDDDGDDDDGDDDDDDDPDAEKSEEELRAELKTVRESLQKANGQSAKRRRALREREAELERERSKKTKKGAAEDDEVDLDEIRERAKREGAAPAILRAKKAEAKSSLLSAGVNPARVAKAVGLLPLDELELDDDGLDGVDDEIEELRKSWPELFARPRKKRESTAGENDAGGERRGRDGAKTASELAAAKLLGR